MITQMHTDGFNKSNANVLKRQADEILKKCYCMEVWNHLYFVIYSPLYQADTLVVIIHPLSAFLLSDWPTSSIRFLIQYTEYQYRKQLKSTLFQW